MTTLGRLGPRSVNSRPNRAAVSWTQDASSQRLVRSGPKHKLPVIRQDAVGQQFDRISGESVRQHALECLVISGLMKQPQPSVPTIENV